MKKMKKTENKIYTIGIEDIGLPTKKNIVAPVREGIEIRINHILKFSTNK